MASNSNSSSQAAAPNKASNTNSITHLLRKDPIDWILIKERAKTDKDSVPKGIVARVLLAGARGLRQPTLPFDLFEWFLLRCGESAGYRGYGMTTKKKASRRMRIQEQRWQMEIVLQDYCASYFYRCESLESAKLFWSAFKDSRWVQRDATKCILRLFEGRERTDTWNWSATKMNHQNDVWECCTFLLRELAVDCPWAHNEQGDVLLGHALFHLLIREHQDDIDVTSSILCCLQFLHKHNPIVFLEQNSEGDTVLHTIVNQSTQIARVLRGFLYYNDCSMRTIVTLILKLTPESCKIRNMEGCLPLHKALHVGLYDWALFLQTACPSTVDSKCLVTGLFPFQLASLYERVQVCSCEICRPVCEEDEEESESASPSPLECAYLLLQHSPHILVLPSSVSEDAVDNDGDEEHFALAKEELQLMRERLEIERMKRKLTGKEKALSVKKRKLERKRRLIRQRNDEGNESA